MHEWLISDHMSQGISSCSAAGHTTPWALWLQWLHCLAGQTLRAQTLQPRTATLVETGSSLCACYVYNHEKLKPNSPPNSSSHSQLLNFSILLLHTNTSTLIGTWVYHCNISYIVSS